MNLFVSHISALEYWDARWQGSQPQPTRALPQAQRPRANASLLTTLKASGVGLPVHNVVPCRSARSQAPSLLSHMWAASQQRGLYTAEDGFCVSTPEATFFQLASQLNFVELVALGTRLCGTYAFAPEEHTGFVRRNQLTTSAELRRLLPRMRGIRGWRQAYRALRFIADGSASPRETEVALLLCLPISAGGYGLPLPQFNYEITARHAAGGMREVPEQRFCDLFWPQARVALEYDSDQWHSEGWKKDADAARRTTLELNNVTVISVRNEQVADIVKFDEVAQLVAKKLGKRLQFNCDDVVARRRQLRRQLCNLSIK